MPCPLGQGRCQLQEGEQAWGGVQGTPELARGLTAGPKLETQAADAVLVQRVEEDQ